VDVNAIVKAVSSPATRDARVTTPVVMTPGAYVKERVDAFWGARPCVCVCVCECVCVSVCVRVCMKE